MSTKLLAGLLAMVVVAGVGIYSGVSQFYAVDATPLSAMGGGCGSGGCSGTVLPVCAETALKSCCPGDASAEEEGCCAALAAASAKSKTEFIGVCVGGMGTVVEPKAKGCAKCAEECEASK